MPSWPTGRLSTPKVCMCQYRREQCTSTPAACTTPSLQSLVRRPNSHHCSTKPVIHSCSALQLPAAASMSNLTVKVISRLSASFFGFSVLQWSHGCHQTACLACLDHGQSHIQGPHQLQLLLLQIHLQRLPHSDLLDVSSNSHLVGSMAVDMGTNDVPGEIGAVGF